MIILDANILIRAVLGKRVRQLLETYAVCGVRFYAPEVAYADAERYLPALLSKRGKPDTDVPAALAYLEALVEPIGHDGYGLFEVEARQRFGEGTRKTGRCLPPRCLSPVTSGLRTRISSGPGSLSGLRIESKSS